MWLADKPVMWLVLGAQTVQVGLRGRAGWDGACHASTPVRGPDVASLVQALESLGDAMQGGLRGRAAQAHVLVSDHWLGCASVPWSAALLTPAHAMREAADHLQAAGHALEAADTLCLEDAPRGQPRLVLAFPAALTQAVCRWAAGSGIGSVRLGSLGVHAASRVTRDGAAAPAVLAVLEPTDLGARAASLVRMDATRRSVEQIITRRVAHREALGPMLARVGWAADAAACMVLDASQPPGAAAVPPDPSAWLQWLSQSRPARAQALDLALARQAATSTVYRSASAGGPIPAAAAIALVLLVCGIGWLGGQVHAHWRQLQAGQLARQMAATAVRQVEAPMTRDQSERLAAVNQAIAHLNIPLDGVLQAIQPPRDIRVSLLGLEASAPAGGTAPAQAVAAPTIKVLAEAPSATDMTRYVSYLSGRAPLTGAQLSRHEVGADGKAGPAYRFAVDVEWQQ
ncbi:MAG: hypothetical protein AB7P37_11880 [Ramlibacter sp.]